MSEIICEYYKLANLDLEVFTITGKLEGEYKSYYPNGNIFTICNYNNNKLIGEYKEYYPNGQLKFIRLYH
jgi:antitoxin component YwqK of YwqJK toxin-antitoxin module